MSFWSLIDLTVRLLPEGTSYPIGRNLRNRGCSGWGDTRRNAPSDPLWEVNAWLGRDAEAKVAVANLLKLMPRFTAQSMIEWGKRFSDNPVHNQQIARMAEGLRKAGLPDGDRKAH
jgi:hypothetical protein